MVLMAVFILINSGIEFPPSPNDVTFIPPNLWGAAAILGAALPQATRQPPRPPSGSALPARWWSSSREPSLPRGCQSRSPPPLLGPVPGRETAASRSKAMEKRDINLSNEEHYLGSCRLHLALLLLVLFVGSGVDHQLLTPPWDGRDDVFKCVSVHPVEKPAQQNQDSPIDDLFILSSDEVFLLRGDDAQGVLLARLGLGVDDVCAQVHVHRALRQRAGLKGDTTRHLRIGLVYCSVERKLRGSASPYSFNINLYKDNDITQAPNNDTKLL